MAGSWTTEQLEALESAIALGVLKVKFGEREMEYRSLKEMRELRDTMRKELGLTPKGSRRKYASYSREC